jgi:cytochrome c biogenesis protein
VTESTRRSGELTVRELLRWGWRQLTSMRTALLLLLLLAVAAIPGSVIPQNGVDSLKASQWRDAHPSLTPLYERLGLFHVFSTPWFAAIYLLLLISLVGCFIPRILVYAKALRARPPRTPRNLDRLQDHASYVTQRSASEVLDRAEGVLAKYQQVRDDDSVSAERGRLREAGNLLFHVSVLVVLIGFAMTSLLGYKGGVIVIVGQGWANNLTQYDDFAPGAFFDPDQLDDFSFDINKFDITWLEKGPAKGQARGFVSHLDYSHDGGPDQTYDLKVNHPLTIGGTEMFLIGHGYAPVITVRDGEGNIAWSGPTVFLPEDQTFTSIGVVKAQDAEPKGIGLRGWFYPTYAFTDASGPFSVMGEAKNPALSMQVYAGDLGLDSGASQSVYALDTSKASLVKKGDGKPFRLDLALGQTKKLPQGLGSVSFDRLEQWNKLKISRVPGVRIALAGVLMALLGLLGSLFIRPRRTWVRARETEDGTLVEVAVLDRAGGDDVAPVLAEIVARLKEEQET